MDVAALGRRHPVGLRDLPRVPRRRSSARASALNFAAYIGHTPLRLYVMGDEASERAATRRRDRRRWRRWSREAIDAGAVGFATSFAITHRGADGQPIPSRLAERGEIEALVRRRRRRRPRRRRRQRRATSLHFDDIYDLQPRARRTGHLHRAADARRPAPTSKALASCTARVGQGRRGVAAGVAAARCRSR